jgi:peptidoglycan/xylan/chitin deacetylase (PgdA/CDA1 family)
MQLRELLKSALCRRIPRRRGRSVILLYHSVGGNSRVAIRTDRFAAHMEMLRDSCTVVDLPELVRRTAQGETGLVAVTFDDGYRDNYDNAFPILVRLGFPFTIFVTTGLVLNGRCDWSAEYAALPALTWEQLQEMNAYGATIGCHTHTHRQWSSLSSHEIRRELDISKGLLEEKLACDISCFAYPFGQPHDIDARGSSLLSMAGFQFAFTTLHTSIDSIRNPFQIPRLTIGPGGSIEEFVQTLYGQRDVLATIEKAKSACHGVLCSHGMGTGAH